MIDCQKKFKKIRMAILTHLDRKKWVWNPVVSNLLEQIDSKLFMMRQKIHERE